MASPPTLHQARPSELTGKLQNMGTGILKKDACIVLVKTEWNAGTESGG